MNLNVSLSVSSKDTSHYVIMDTVMNNNVSPDKSSFFKEIY